MASPHGFHGRSNATINGGVSSPGMTVFGPLPPGAPVGFSMTKPRLERNIGSGFVGLAFFLGAFWVFWCRNRTIILRKHAAAEQAAAAAAEEDGETGTHCHTPKRRRAPVHWQDPKAYEKAWRPISSFFSVLIPILLLNAVDTCSIWHSWLANKCIHAEPLFSVVTSYFVADTLLMTVFRPKLWPVFILHHVIAASPYITNNFLPGCSQGHLLLSLGLMVEFTTPFINWCWWLEGEGQQGSARYLVAQMITWLLWVPFRILLPGYLLYKTYEWIVPTYGAHPMVFPAYVMAHFINFFCVVTFVFVLTPALAKSWGQLCCAWCCQPTPAPPSARGTTHKKLFQHPEQRRPRKRKNTRRAKERQNYSDLPGCNPNDGVGWLGGGPADSDDNQDDDDDDDDTAEYFTRGDSNEGKDIAVPVQVVDDNDDDDDDEQTNLIRRV